MIMAFECKFCNGQGSVPKTITDGRVMEWKECPDLDCKAFRKEKHKDEDKVKGVIK